MKLTCVTAVFNAVAAGNRERLIRCVKSVAALKTEHEHLVYDGASTDGTVELLRELEAQTLGLKVVSEKDTGIYNALNKGVRDASGEWLYVLGCDDYLKAPTVLDALLDRDLSDIQVCVSPVWKDYGGDIREIGFVRRNLFFGMPYCHQGVLIRTKLARTLGRFDERYRISADYDMILKCHLKACKVRYFATRYAAFSNGGISGQSQGMFGESIDIMREQLGLSQAQTNRFKETLSLPLMVVVPYLFHRDATLRWASLYMIARWGLCAVKYFRKALA